MGEVKSWKVVSKKRPTLDLPMVTKMEGLPAKTPLMAPFKVTFLFA